MRIVPCDSVLLFSLRGIRLHLLNLLATQASQFHRILHTQQRIKSRTDNVVRIRRTQHLGADVSNTDCLHNRTYRAARDHASTFRSRFDEHTTSTVFTNQLMRQRVVDQRHANQILLRSLNTFLDCERHFARFAGAESDVPTFVAYYYERCEREVLTTFYDLGDAVNGDHLVFKI